MENSKSNFQSWLQCMRLGFGCALVRPRVLYQSKYHNYQSKGIDELKLV